MVVEEGKTKSTHTTLLKALTFSNGFDPAMTIIILKIEQYVKHCAS